MGKKIEKRLPNTNTSDRIINQIRHEREETERKNLGKPMSEVQHNTQTGPAKLKKDEDHIGNSSNDEAQNKVLKITRTYEQ